MSQIAGNYQGPHSIAIGYPAGPTYQGSTAIAIGMNAGATMQDFNSIAIGYAAGQTGQGTNNIAIGYQTWQGTNGIAIGQYAGITNQWGPAHYATYRAGPPNITVINDAIATHRQRDMHNFIAPIAAHITRFNFAVPMSHISTPTVQIGRYIYSFMPWRASSVNEIHIVRRDADACTAGKYRDSGWTTCAVRLASAPRYDITQNFYELISATTAVYGDWLVHGFCSDITPQSHCFYCGNCALPVGETYATHCRHATHIAAVAQLECKMAGAMRIPEDAMRHIFAHIYPLPVAGVAAVMM